MNERITWINLDWQFVMRALLLILINANKMNAKTGEIRNITDFIDNIFMEGKQNHGITWLIHR